MAVLYPVIGQWFSRPNGTLFEVVAVDEDGGTVELQQFDGTIDEVDLETWPDLFLVEVSAPRTGRDRWIWTPKIFSAGTTARYRRAITTRWTFWTTPEHRAAPPDDVPQRLVGPLT